MKYLFRFHQKVLLFADFSPGYMFLTLLCTATRYFRPLFGPAHFAGLAFMLLLAQLAIEEAGLPR